MTSENSFRETSKIKSWILASRPKTLLASFVPVLIGSSVAFNAGKFNAIAAFVALLCSLLIQIGTNFVNDLYDFLKGVDNKERLGPTRALASGLLTPVEMKFGIYFCFILTFMLGLYLVYISDWIILVVGILSILAGIAYTAGPYPLAYNALGDLFVFIFFGFVGTIGSYYVQTLSVNLVILLASIPVGALITNILIINNYRDIDGDRKSGKITLAVKFGKIFTRVQYTVFIGLSYAVLLFIVFFLNGSYLLLLPFLSFPFAIRLIKMLYVLNGKELNNTLELTAKFSALFGILMAAGFVLC